MTVLETFMAFAKGLPADRMQSVEEALATLMESYSAQNEFTIAELAELERRAAVSDPHFANPDEIDGLLGKSRQG